MRLSQSSGYEKSTEDQALRTAQIFGDGVSAFKAKAQTPKPAPSAFRWSAASAPFLAALRLGLDNPQQAACLAAGPGPPRSDLGRRVRSLGGASPQPPRGSPTPERPRRGGAAGPPTRQGAGPRPEAHPSRRKSRAPGQVGSAGRRTSESLEGSPAPAGSHVDLSPWAREAVRPLGLGSAPRWCRCRRCTGSSQRCVGACAEANLREVSLPPLPPPAAEGGPRSQLGGRRRRVLLAALFTAAGRWEPCSCPSARGLKGQMRWCPRSGMFSSQRKA